jgi:peptidoglycan/xylan/chitin deacetylase (PgdA/CDA1 family)
VRADPVRRTLARVHRPRVLPERRAIGALSVCFDDFPKTAWTEGASVMRAHGARGTFFVSGSLCGTTAEGQVMYDEHDLQAAHAEGHEIGCHTFDHRSCLRSTVRELERSRRDNQAFVSRHLGEVRLVSFAYPFGDATVSAKRFTVQRFACARGVDAGLNTRRLDLGQLRAVGLEVGKRSLEVVESYVRSAAARRAWLIVFTHDVQDRPSTWGCRPDDLDRVLRLAKSSGLEILPVKAALGARAFAASRA